MDHRKANETALRDYFHTGKLCSATKNSEILSTNDRKESIYLIISGYIRIYSNNKRRDQYTHIIYGPGEVFPLSWLSAEKRTQVSYEALTDCEFYSVPVATFQADLKRNPELSYAMLQRTIEQYRIYTMRVDNLEYKYASERLAYRLILLANRFGERNETTNEVTITPQMTHQLIGSSLNLSRESVSREMEKLLRMKLVRYNKARQIVICDVRQLSERLQVPMHQGLDSEYAASMQSIVADN